MSRADPGRVLLVGDYPPPMGGVAVHVRQLHDALSRRGLRVTGVDLGQGTHAHVGVTRARPGAPLASALFDAPEALTHLHTSGNNPRSFAVAAEVGLLRGLRGPAVVTLHSGLLPAFLAGARARRLAARVALAPYARIIAVSEAVADALHGAGVAAARVRVHPAFVASEVRPRAPSAAVLERLARHRLLLGFAHHPSPIYGRALFFQVLARLRRRQPGLGVALFGPGTDAPEFEAAARAAGVSDALEVLGELPQPDALGVMARCEVFVRPTIADGDAISVREALALGVRCVASDASVRPEGVHLFATGRPEALERAIEAALTAPRPRAAGPDAADFLVAQYAQSWAERTPRDATKTILGKAAGNAGAGRSVGDAGSTAGEGSAGLQQ